MNYANEALRNLFYELLDGDPNESAKRGVVDQFFATYEVAISLHGAVNTDRGAPDDAEQHD